MLISIVTSWTELQLSSRENRENRRKFTFYMTTPEGSVRDIAREIRAKLLELGWTVVPHPPYSPDLAPSDYHLFRSLANHLQERKFDNEDALKLALETFFSQKSTAFYERGILSLPERWRQVIDSDGAYIT